jgi:hypothetical protein
LETDAATVRAVSDFTAISVPRFYGSVIWSSDKRLILYQRGNSIELHNGSCTIAKSRWRKPAQLVTGRMDTETVVAAGFVIHELLGLVGGLILCYFGYRLLMRRVRVRQSKPRGAWNLAKRFAKNAAPGLLFALLGAGAIWLTASNAFAPKASSLKNPVDVSMPSARAEARANKPAENGAAALVSRAAIPQINQGQSGTMAKDDSTVDQLPPGSAPTTEIEMLADRNALANNSQFGEPDSIESSRKTAEAEPQKADRKTLERERRAAERKRSRLEEMYQNHSISSDAYKKGEEEYKNEIVKYRSAMNAGRGVPE